MKRQNGFFSVSRACFVALPVIILTACAGGTLDGKEHNHESTLAADLVPAGAISEKNYRLEEMPVPLREIVMSDMTTQAGNRTVRILLVMTEGEYTTEVYEASAGGVYSENFRGSYELRTLTEQGEQIDHLVLTDESGEHEFNFGGEFALTLEDYNQDGCPDFTLGTWGSSSMGVYYLYTVTESGKIEQVYPDGIADTGFAFSKALERTEEPGFAVSLYNQADGSYSRIVYAWEENPEEFSGSYVPEELTQESNSNTEESLSSDGQEMKRIAEEFVTAYFNGDAGSITKFLSVPFEWDVEVYTGTGTISEVSLKGLTDIGEKENGSVQVVSVEYIDSDLGDSYRYLTLEFIKQENEWKIQFYGIEG